MRPVSNGATMWRHCQVCLLLGYHNYYAIHRSPYTSTHVLIENTLVQHKMAKSSRMALCCQNQVSKGTNQCYGLHDSSNISVHSASVMVLGLLKKNWKKHSIQNGVFAVFRLATKNTLTVVINGLDRSGHASVCCLATYFYM